MTKDQFVTQTMRTVFSLRWVAAAVVGYALGMTVSTVLVGATARPLTPVLGGSVFVVLFGALIGIGAAIPLFIALPRGAVRFPAWIAANALGAAAGFTLASFVGEILANVISPTTIVVIGGGAIQIGSGAMVGLGIGVAQWRVLRPLLPTARRWIVASMIGAGLGYGAATGVLELLDLPVLKASLVPSFGAILGIVIGIAQGLVLRSRASRA